MTRCSFGQRHQPDSVGCDRPATTACFVCGDASVRMGNPLLGIDQYDVDPYIEERKLLMLPACFPKDVKPDTSIMGSDVVHAHFPGVSYKTIRRIGAVSRLR